MSENHISPQYLTLLKQTHEQDPQWGTSATRRLPEVLTIAGEHAVREVLDYGCGKGALVDAMLESGLDAHGYDPAVPAFEARPARAPLLVCIDVLEHIEPDCLDSVLKDIALLAPVAYLVIALFPARKILPDGRNAHLIVQPPEWWMQRLGQVFGRVTVRHTTRSWLGVVAYEEARP